MNPMVESEKDKSTGIKVNFKSIYEPMKTPKDVHRVYLISFGRHKSRVGG